MSQSGASRSSMMSNQGGMYEPESIRLQREVDEFTQRLEHEKSHLTIIEEQIKQVRAELEERNTNVKTLRPTQLQDKYTKIKIASSQKSVNNERLKLNMTKAKNEGLRREIDMLRKELTSSKNECMRYEKLIKKSSKNAEDQNQGYQAVTKIAEETNNRIVALQAKYEEEKDRFEEQIQKLQLKLKEKDEMFDPLEDKTLDKNKDHEEGKGSDFSNPIVILKRRLNKITETNKEKRKLMDQYIRNVKVIEDAFDQIKQATGISNIEEIVTTFIKAEEQNYSLQNYVNMLNTEFDQLEDSNKEIKEQIQKIVERGQLSQQEKVNLEKSLNDECEMLSDEITRNFNDAEQTKKMFRKIQSHVNNMVDMFKRSKFFLCVAQKQNYEDGIIFTENNIVSYLAELEEYISSLITYSAFKRDEPNAAIASIPLDRLTAKDFQQRNTAPDLPINWTAKEGAEQTSPAAIDGMPNEGEGDIFNARELFAKFTSDVENNRIQFQFNNNNRNQAQNFNNKEEDDVSLS